MGKKLEMDKVYLLIWQPLKGLFSKAISARFSYRIQRLL